MDPHCLLAVREGIRGSFAAVSENMWQQLVREVRMKLKEVAQVVIAAIAARFPDGALDRCNLMCSE